MRPKEGSKIELQRDLSDSVRFVRFGFVRFVIFADFRDLKKMRDGRTDPLIEMRGRI